MTKPLSMTARPLHKTPEIPLAWPSQKGRCLIVNLRIFKRYVSWAMLTQARKPRAKTAENHRQGQILPPTKKRRRNCVGICKVTCCFSHRYWSNCTEDTICSVTGLRRLARP